MEIALMMATDKAEQAFDATTQPGDAPQSWKEVMSRLDKDKWIDAAQMEMDTLIANGTWELVKLPPRRKQIGSRWVFLIKRNTNSSID
jgi:membrane peptidoglycan carboxypeptidase